MSEKRFTGGPKVWVAGFVFADSRQIPAAEFSKGRRTILLLRWEKAASIGFRYFPSYDYLRLKAYFFHY